MEGRSQWQMAQIIVLLVPREAIMGGLEYYGAVQSPAWGRIKHAKVNMKVKMRVLMMKR
jgi:hypothetical protein